MMIIRMLAIIGILLPPVSHACIPARMPTESTEPVTIKIADTYFQIPEGYLAFPFLRVPMERKYIQFALPAHILFPSLSDKAERDRTLQIQLLQPEQKGTGNVRVPISEKVAIVYSDKYSRIKGISASIVEKYIRSISSANAPETWEKDRELAEKFRLGTDPCRFSMLSSAINSVKDTFILNYEDIVAGLNHRNETVRAAAASRAGNVDSEHKSDALKRLQAILHDESSDNVRVAAIRGMLEMAEEDSQLIPLLIEIMAEDKSDRVRGTISSRLSKLGDNIAENLVSLLENDNKAIEGDIGNALVWIINNEVREENITSYRDLSAESTVALGGIIRILPNLDSETLERILNPLKNSKSAIASPEFISTLVQLFNESEGKTAGIIAGSLSRLGEAGYASIPLMITRMKSSQNLDELWGLTEAFQHMGKNGIEAVPILIELSTFKNEPSNVVVHTAGVQNWMIRLNAIIALQSMNVRTPEVKAAIEVAINDPNGMVRSQAIATFKEFQK